MNKSTLGLFAVFVLVVGVLAHSAGDAFAISYKNETSSAQKKIQDDKMKASEKRQKVDTPKASEKSIGKTQKAVKHKTTTIKKQRLAQGIKP